MAMICYLPIFLGLLAFTIAAQPPSNHLEKSTSETNPRIMSLIQPLENQINILYPGLKQIKWKNEMIDQFSDASTDTEFSNFDSVGRDSRTSLQLGFIFDSMPNLNWKRIARSPQSVETGVPQENMEEMTQKGMEVVSEAAESGQNSAEVADGANGEQSVLDRIAADAVSTGLEVIVTGIDIAKDVTSVLFP